jgi:hypothetical protein
MNPPSKGSPRFTDWMGQQQQRVDLELEAASPLLPCGILQRSHHA